MRAATKIKLTASESVKVSTTLIGSCSMTTSLPAAFRDVEYFVVTLPIGHGGSAFMLLVAKDNSQSVTVVFSTATGVVRSLLVLYIRTVR